MPPTWTDPTFFQDRPGRINRHTCEHHAAVGDGIGKREGLTIYGKVDVTKRTEVKARRRDHDIRFQMSPGLQANAGLGEALDVVGDN
jgi:hypothetical protein